MTFEVKKDALPVDVSDKTRDLTAPWILEHTGQPRLFSVPAGVGLYYDLINEIVHLRDTNTGMARTYAPNIDVYINHGEAFYDVGFDNPEEPWVNYPSWQIIDGRVRFIHSENFMASNTAMFATVCRYLNSPIYNPFVATIENAPDDEYKISIRDSLIRHRNGDPVDEAFADLKSFDFVSQVPIPGYDRFETKDNCELPPGRYSGTAIKTDPKTGQIIRFEVEGAERSTVHMWRILVEHDDILGPFQRGELTMSNVEGPSPLTFDAWEPKSFTPNHPLGQSANRGGLLERLFGKR